MGISCIDEWSCEPFTKEQVELIMNRKNDGVRKMPTTSRNWYKCPINETKLQQQQLVKLMSELEPDYYYKHLKEYLDATGIDDPRILAVLKNAFATGYQHGLTYEHKEAYQQGYTDGLEDGSHEHRMI